jgi:hypothetical protein
MNGASRTSRAARLAAWPAATVLLVTATAFVVANWAAATHDPGNVILLVALSVFAYVADDFSLPAFRLDVGLVLAFAAMILSGPVGALVVFAIPELIRPLVERHRVRRIATVANLASFAWAVLVAQALLLALGTSHTTFAGRWLTYALVATAMVLMNVIVTRGLVAGLVDQVLVSGWRMEVRALAATLVLAPFAALTACLLPSVGILALIVVAAAAALPGILVHLVAWRPRAGGLTVPEARARYAAAIASGMSLSRSQRRVLIAAARTGTGRTDARLSAADERDRVAKTLILAGLWSRSEDCFSRLQPAEMGIESRVLVVAHGWAELTASGSEQLEHRLALLTLHNNPCRYDRRIVALARELIPESERDTREARVPHRGPRSRRIAQLKPVA